MDALAGLGLVPSAYRRGRAVEFQRYRQLDRSYSGAAGGAGSGKTDSVFPGMLQSVQLAVPFLFAVYLHDAGNGILQGKASAEGICHCCFFVHQCIAADAGLPVADLFGG